MAPSLALVVLVALAVLSPWPFGSAHPRAAQAIALAALATSLVVLAGPVLRRGLVSFAHWDRPATLTLAGALGLWLLAAMQLAPLPAAPHAWLAPGSAAVWHPAEPAALAVLGSGLHPVSLHPAATLRWLAFFAALVSLGLVAAPALRERRIALRAAVVVTSGAVLVALFGFVGRLWFADRLYGVLAVPTIAPFGPFVSKNHFAGYVEMAALLAAGLAAGLASENRSGPGPLGWIESPRAPRVMLAAAAAAVLALAVPVSLSRGGAVSLVAGLAVFVLLLVAPPERAAASRTRHQRALRFGTAAAALAVALVAIAIVLPPEARARVVTLGDASSAYRLGLWRDSLRLVASSPLLGSGLGAYADAIPRFKTGAGDVRVEHAENDWLELVAEGGLVAAALALVAVGALFTAAWRRLRDEPHRLVRGLRTGALAGLVALAVHSLFDFNLRLPSNALLAALLAAFALAPSSHHSRPAQLATDPAGASPVRGGVSSSGAVILLVLSLSLLATLWVPWRPGERPTARLSATSGALRRAAAEAEAEAAVRRRPADAEAWVVLAWLRSTRSPAEAAALGAWAARLDPQHRALVEAAERLRPSPER
jgi:O-antigen ligase